MYLPYFDYAFVNGHLCSFSLLTIMNNAAIDVGIQISIHVPAFTSFWANILYIPSFLHPASIPLQPHPPSKRLLCAHHVPGRHCVKSGQIRKETVPPGGIQREINSEILGDLTIQPKKSQLLWYIWILLYKNSISEKISPQLAWRNGSFIQGLSWHSGDYMFLLFRISSLVPHPFLQLQNLPNLHKSIFSWSSCCNLVGVYLVCPFTSVSWPICDYI